MVKLLIGHKGIGKMKRMIQGLGAADEAKGLFSTNWGSPVHLRGRSRFL